MQPISDELYGLLMRQGLARGTGATVGTRGIGDGERTGKSALSHQPAGEGGEPRPMGMGLEKDADRQKPAPVNRGMRQRFGGGSTKDNLKIHDFVVHTNHAVSNMPTRQGAMRRTPSLVCIEGGKR